MMRKLLWVLLAASVAFNGFFAVGYFRARSQAQALQTFEGRARLWTQDLDLDAHQQEVFERLLRETTRLRGESRRAGAPLTERMLAELAKDQPDEAVLLAYARQDRPAEYRQALVFLLRDFVAALRPEQKQRFLESLRRRLTS